MDVNLKRRSRERAIASEIANEIHRQLGPSVMPEALAVKNDVICEIFGDAFDSHSVTESAAARILSYVPAHLVGLNLKQAQIAANFADLNRKLDAVIRQPLTRNN
jgi:hypothetical protein